MASRHVGPATDHRRDTVEPARSRPTAAAVRRRLRALWSRIDERLESMSPRGLVRSVLAAIAALLLLIYPICSLVPPLGRLVLFPAGLALGAVATLPFTRILAKSWDDPLVIPPFRGWRGWLRAGAHLGAGIAVLVATAQVFPSTDDISNVFILAVSTAFGSAGTLWLIGILVLQSDD